MIFNIGSILEDPISFLTSLLLLLPGVCLAISIHESAHGWVAEKCGDPTARYAGRITLNPLKHFDPVGFLFILFVGFGWAKPVPVNPLMYKNYRRDDLKVSLAGITANLLLFIVCFILIQAIFTGAIAALPDYDELDFENQSILELDGDVAFKFSLGDNKYVFSQGYTWDGEDLYGASGCYYSYYAEDGKTLMDASDIVVRPAFGRLVAVLYKVLCNCMIVNLSLAVFNLIPIPPFDGYHVLNDLVLRQDLFAQRRTQNICTIALIVLIMVGNIKPEWDVISIVLRGVRSGVIGGLSSAVRSLAETIGVL